MPVPLADKIPCGSKLAMRAKRARFGLRAWCCGLAMSLVAQAPLAQLKEPLVPPAVAEFSLDPAQPGLQETLWIAKTRSYKFSLRFEDTGTTLAEKTRVWNVLDPPRPAKRASKKTRSPPLRFKLEIRELDNPRRAPVFSRVVDSPKAIRVAGAMTKALVSVKLEPGEYEVTLAGVEVPETLHPVRTSLSVSFNPKADIGAQ